MSTPTHNSQSNSTAPNRTYSDNTQESDKGALYHHTSSYWSCRPFWADIDRQKGKKHKKRKKRHKTRYSFEEILYADDTLLFGPSIKKVERKLHRIEKESARYGLSLNLKKMRLLGHE